MKRFHDLHRPVKIHIVVAGHLRHDKSGGILTDHFITDSDFFFHSHPSLYDYIFDTLRKEALISDVFTLNKGVIQLHLLCGCEIVEEKKAHICKNGVFLMTPASRPSTKIIQ